VSGFFWVEQFIYPAAPSFILFNALLIPLCLIRALIYTLGIGMMQRGVRCLLT